MKTYRNEQLGFEIEIPEEWSFSTDGQVSHSPGKNYSLFFRCRSNESFKFQVKTLTLQPDLRQTEDTLRSFVHERGYTSLGLGRLTIAGQEHVWARYYRGYGNWSKKYILTSNNIEYTFTAGCQEQKLLLEMEQSWDEVVSSFRVLMIVDEVAQSQSASTGQKGEVVDKQPVDAPKITSQPAAQQKPAGTKTYLNEKHGFEIDIPEVWAPAPELPTGLMNALAGPIPPGLKKDVFQYGCYDEAINFEIAPLYPEPLLDDTVIEFKVFAKARGFMDLHLGRINVAGKEHVCAHYFINDKMGPRWNKKYMLVFGGIEYALTVTCNDPQWFARREKEWDAIIQSFHVLAPVDDSANKTARADRDRQKRREIVEALQDPAKIYARAYEAMALGQNLEARLLLEEYLRNKPDHIQAHKDLGALFQRMGDITGAIEHLREVERLDPSDAMNRSNLARLVEESHSRSNLHKKAVPTANADRPYPSPVSSSHTSRNVQPVNDTSKQAYTLAYSIRSYLLIVLLSYLYIISRPLAFRELLFLTSAAHQPLTTSEFNMLWVILFFGIGASICLIFLLGVVLNAESSNNTSTIFGFIERTMHAHNKEQKTLAGLFFSDYTRKSAGVLDALWLQVMNMIRALFKILLIFFSVGLLRPIMSLTVAILFFGPQLILHRPESILWQAGTALLWFYSCYRAMLFWLARMKGVTTESYSTYSRQMIANPSLDASIQSAMTQGVTPDFVMKVLGQESVVNAIKNDLLKTDQLGYKETWRLGLITPDQDWFDPRADPGAFQERTRKYFSDINYRYKWMEQIPLKRTAILHSAGYFNVQFNNILITDGKFKQFWPRWSNYRLRTVLNEGEYIRLRNIQIDTDRPYAENRSPSLTKFLREDGFPLKESYAEGDPLSTDRGGVIVIDQGKTLITHPKYFVQRRLIDDEGNVVDMGIDENFRLSGGVDVKMRPAELNSLVRYAASNGYVPVLRYHYSPYRSDFMLPILDAPISTSGWADLYVDASGRAKLFIAKEKTLAEWYEMMDKLRQLFYSELAKKHYRLLGLTKDKDHLSDYLFKKQNILRDYYLIQDWELT